jgi:hypothetical protein
MNVLPADIREFAGHYRVENRFLDEFINKYYINNIIENYFDVVPLEKEFNDLLSLNNMKSKLDLNQDENNIWYGKFNMNYSDIIDINIIKQFILLILPYLFNDVLAESSVDWKNTILNRINDKLRQFQISLAIVGCFTTHHNMKFYLFDCKNNIEIKLRIV